MIGLHLNVNRELALRKRREKVRVNCDDVVLPLESFHESVERSRLLWIALRR